MGDLYGRVWEVVVDGLALDGFDLSFRVESTKRPTPNKAEVTIYNLGPALRSRLTRTKTPDVQIRAGYEAHNAVIFRGQAREIVHSRTQTDWETKVACGDGEVAMGKAQSSRSYVPGAMVSQVVADLVADLGVADTRGAVARFSAAVAGMRFANGTTLEGPTPRELSALLASYGWGWSVQAGVICMAPLGEPYAPQAVLLSAGSGLIDPSPSLTPKGEFRAVSLLRPDILPGAVVVVESAAVSGNFLVEKTTHAGETAGDTWQVEIQGKEY